jgi:hypothetical protein
MIDRRRSTALRDQEKSSFSAMLTRFCESTSTLGAALVDQEGETVDYAGKLSPYDIRIAAAELRLILSLLQRSRVRAWRNAESIYLRAQHRSFAVITLGEGYALVVVLRRRAFTISPRALSELVREVSREAGLESRPGTSQTRERWTRVEVRTAEDDRRRPALIWHGGTWCPLVIIGRYREEELRRREIGFRARLTSGEEFTLVREPLGSWYADAL